MTFFLDTVGLRRMSPLEYDEGNNAMNVMPWLYT